MILLIVFFDKCHLVNYLLETKGLFLRIHEKRDKFRYLMKKGVTGKSNVTRNLSPCVIQKFNGYEVLKHQLKRPEKQFYVPIDIIYEPVNDDRHNSVFFYR